MYNQMKVTQKKTNRKRKKKYARRKTQIGCKNKKKQCKLAKTMSAWAENFTVAATWQIKHQMAFWKARAKALEYENGVLHEIIRKNNYVNTSTATSTKQESESDFEESEKNEDDEEDLEVTEEFIQFLQINAKYKEDARRERERLKAKNLAKENGCENSEYNEEKLKELYGARWERIAALEMSLQSQFINEYDKEQPLYWPNIPFNFNVV